MSSWADASSPSEAADPSFAELQAFAAGLGRLNFRQREVLRDVIGQVVRLEAVGDHVAVARLLEDAAALLRISAATN